MAYERRALDVEFLEESGKELLVTTDQVVVEALGRITGAAERRYVDRDHPATACQRRDDPAPRVRGVAVSVQQDDRSKRRGGLRGRVDDVRLAAGDVEQPARELHPACVEQAW